MYLVLVSEVYSSYTHPHTTTAVQYDVLKAYLVGTAPEKSMIFCCTIGALKIFFAREALPRARPPAPRQSYRPGPIGQLRGRLPP